ncbi:MAG: hypothetical protein QUT27_00525, partial [candidate division Zixibacteria bacterium]|nr:hypothetical protein [candidate division Zixibacteria bacterium]
SLSGYCVVALCYVGLHRHLDFGASTSDSYINVFTEPVEFLQAAFERFFVYINSVFLPVPAGSSRIGGDKYWYLAIMLYVSGMILLPLLLYVFRQVLRQDRSMAFWFFGALLSTLPITAAPAQDRLTLFLTVGIDIFIANVIYYALLAGKSGPLYPYNEKYLQKTAKAFVVFHLILSPLHLLGGTTIMSVDTRSLLENALAFDDEVGIAGKKLVVMEMPLGIAISMMGMRKAMGEQLPESVVFVGNEEGETRYQILSDREIRVSRDIGFAIGYEMVFRSVEKEPFRPGQIISMHDLDIEIMEVNAVGRPLVVKLNLDESMHSGRWLFYHFDKGWVRPDQLEAL